MKNDLFPADDSNENAENLRFENELLKLKIIAEFGPSKFSDFPIDPELENLFLKHIIKLEREMAAKKQITVFEKIGQPKVSPPKLIPESELPKVVKDLEMLLKKNGISIIFPKDLHLRDRYLFIVERVFAERLDTQLCESHQVLIQFPRFKSL